VDLETFLDDARELLAIESTADHPDGLAAALEFVVGFTGGDFMTERFASGGKPSALLYHGAHHEHGQWRPRYGVILNAHLDVIPAPKDQFHLRRDDARLYARGAQDMKVSGLVMALVFRELAGQLPYALGLQLVTDEETGGYDGTRHQLELGVTTEFAILGESSGLGISTESKGIANVILRATGRSAHGAYPWLGDNAVLKLQRSLGRILDRYPVPDAEAWRTTVNVARVTSPNTAFNQVPATAEAWLDIRFPAGDPDLDGKTDAEVAAYLAGFCEPGVTAEVQRMDSPAHADVTSPAVTALQAAARRQGYHGGFLRKHGTGDSRFYRQHGMNAVSFGIGGAGQHGPDEYADITTIAPYYEALSDFLRTFRPGWGPG
jgi:succinyl-diaminopimelate desuccinylase